MNVHSLPLDPRATARALGGEAHGNKILAPGPGHSPKDRSLSVLLDPNAPDGFVVNSFAGDDPLACRDHVNKKLGRPAWSPAPKETHADIVERIRRTALDFNKAPRQADHEEEPKRKPFYDGHLIAKGYRLIEAYPYPDENEALLYEVLRYEHPSEGKTFLQRQPDKRGGWLSGAGDRKVLYRWADVRAAVHSVVYVCEGEKDANRLASLGFVAVTVANGTWTDEAIQALEWRDCYILEDNDEKGREKAATAATMLHPVAASVRIVRLPDLPEKGDVSDWLNAGNDHNLLPRIAEKAPLWTPREEEPEAEAKAETKADLGLFPIIGIDDIEIGSEPVWTIQGLLCATGLGVVFGLPKSGKSFLLSDALFHVAMGRKWAGRDVLQGAVAYVSSEGVSGLKRRFVAMRRHYGVEGKAVPFAFIPAMPKLGTSAEDADKLIATIRAWLAQIGNPPLRAIALDTLARAMNGADENAAKDMGVLVANAEKIAAAFDCIVVLVHHAGRSAEARSRGSNALDGAADVMWHVEKGEEQSRATIVAMKDGEDGIEWSFRLNSYQFEEKEGAQQGATSTCTVEILASPGEAQQGAASRSKRPLPSGPKMLLDIAREAIGEAGEQVLGDLNVPHTVRAVSRDMLKRYAKIRGYFEDGKPENQNRAMLSRDLKRLKVERIIGLTDQYLWLRDGGSP